MELADTPDDKIDLELIFKFLNRQVVSEEADERNSQRNLSLKSRIQIRVVMGEGIHSSLK